MLLHSQLPGERQLQACALTIGTFDGVHCGHQALVATARREATQRNLPLAALTFNDMPHCYFRPDDCPLLLTSPDEKARAFERLEVEHLWLIDFDSAVAAREAPDFTAELKQFLGLQLLIVGPDFALGKNRAGDVNALRNFGEELGFEVLVLREKIEYENAPISSTRVRRCVEAGQVEDAARMLGQPFSFEGEVVSGRQLGRTIGVPTINLQLHPRKVVPAFGVYAVRAFFDGEALPHPAALSIGHNESVGGAQLSVEFHVIEETIAAPPKRARVEIVSWLRGQEKFEDLNGLVAQMQLDITRAKDVLFS